MADESTAAAAASRVPIWRRRLPLVVGLAAAVAAAPVAVSVLAPGSPADQALNPLAVAADGTLTCVSLGEVAAIDPAEADLRLLPTRLPDGWEVRDVFASEEETRGYCGPPSLAALRTEGDLVTGAVRVSGPFSEPLQVMESADVVAATVAGQEAQRFGYRFDNPEGPGEVSSYTWLWADETGQHWLADVDGYEVEQAQQLVDTLTTEGDQVSLATAADGLEVVHQRTGAPYDPSMTSLDWFIYFEGGDIGEEGFNSLFVRHTPSHAVPLLARASVGERLVTIEGRAALVWIGPAGVVIEDTDPDASIWDEVDESDFPLGEEYAEVTVEVAPGTAAGMGIHGVTDWQVAADVLLSLEEVPADDPRLE